MTIDDESYGYIKDTGFSDALLKPTWRHTPKNNMDDKDMIRFINKELEVINWTQKERDSSKNITVLPEWTEILHRIVGRYRLTNWEVYWMSEQGGKVQYLQFKSPYYTKGK